MVSVIRNKPKTFEVSLKTISMALTTLRVIKLPGAFFLGKLEKVLESIVEEYNTPYIRITIEGSITGKEKPL